MWRNFLAAPRMETTITNRIPLVTWYLGLSGYLNCRIQENPIVLGKNHQLTQFIAQLTASCAHHCSELGDHLAFLHRKTIVHNKMMQRRERQDGTKNHGTDFCGNESNEAYLERLQEQVRSYAKMTERCPTAQYFVLQEGVVQEAHKAAFEKAISEHLSEWKLAGGSDFGLWFIVKKDCGSFAIDKQLTSSLPGKLQCRLLTAQIDSDYKLSNIHVPHENSVSQYKILAERVMRDLIQCAHAERDTQKEKLSLSITHVVSDKEHMKDSGTRFVSVSGVTELKLTYGNKVYHHDIAGDFNLELEDRQRIDKEVLEKIQQEYHELQWSMKTVIQKAKYLFGIIVGGGVALPLMLDADEATGVLITSSFFGRFGTMKTFAQANLNFSDVGKVIEMAA